jgi:tyrosyl-tRNA synthetase
VLQQGGSDQWGNLTSGTDLIRKVEGASVHALGTPLITNSDGTKFGKSEGNAIWLDAAMCSPFDMYQFWLNTADADVADRLKVFTFLSREEIAALEVSVAERPHLREAQRTLAFQVTSLVHGVDATSKVIAASAALFGQGNLDELDEETLASATRELPRSSAPAEGLSIVDLLVVSGLSHSNSAARRTVGEGGAYVNNSKITDPDAVLGAADALHGKYLLMRRGKRTLSMVELAG